MHAGFPPNGGRRVYGKARTALGANPTSNPRTASVTDRLPPCPRRVKGPRCGPPIGRGGGPPPRRRSHRAAGDAPSRRCSLQCPRACMCDPRGPGCTAGVNMPVGARDRGDRSPETVGSPASLASVDPWPLAIVDTQIPGGSRPAVAAVRRRDRGVRTPHPRAVCRRPSLPERAPWRVSGVRTGPGGLSVGANGWPAGAPMRRGHPRRGRAARAAPSRSCYTLVPLRGGPWAPGGMPVRFWRAGRPWDARRA